MLAPRYVWWLTITGRNVHKKTEKLVKRLSRFFIKSSEFNPDGTAFWGGPEDFPLSLEFEIRLTHQEYNLIPYLERRSDFSSHLHPAD